MIKRNTAAFASAALGMLVLILDSQTAIKGGTEGVELCLRTVVPSLFPFFLLSILLTGAVSEASVLLRPLSILFRSPAGTEPLLAAAFLGGYPVGAQTIAQAYRSKQITERTANRMLSFCNNAGPAFIFGIVAAQFSSPLYGWLIWGVQLVSAMAVAGCRSEHDPALISDPSGEFVSIPQALHRALRVMASVCGWVVIFRVILSFCRRWFFWLLPNDLQVLVTGVLELANGCCLLHTVSDEGLRFVICNIMLSAGGLCVCMQTASVLDGLHIRQYLTGKLLQTGYAAALAEAVRPILTGENAANPLVWILLLLPVLYRLLEKKQKYYSVSTESVV